MPCELCEALPQNVRTSKRHERLRQTGITQRCAGAGKKAAWVTQHVCDLCQTSWQHTDDPADPGTGWSVEKIAETCS